MPFYKNLDVSFKEDERTIHKILALRKELKRQIPKRTHSETLLLATWNIRDFDKSSYGFRLKESFYYLAEIISAFDIVALQEVNENLSAFHRLMDILGGHWKFVFSDTTEGTQGNQERLAYVYDSRKIRFGGLAGELVIPPIRERITLDTGEQKIIYKPVQQIWRTPIICGFQAGWARFMLCSVHVQWGDSSANSEERVKEIGHIASFLKKRTENPNAWARKLILLGDFNIFNKEDKTYQKLAEAGFECPSPLRDKDLYTNVGAKKRQYDQILLREREDRFEFLNGGTFNFFNTVFREDEEDIYHSFMEKPNKEGEFYKSYKQWRTHQMSDHLPLWVELKIDFTEQYLESKLKRA